MQLLDTHTLLWYAASDSQLSEKAKELIDQNKLSTYVSIASLWELAIKINLNKLQLGVPFNQLLDYIYNTGFTILNLDLRDTIYISSLPLIHRDPFDRMLIAQAKNNWLTIITADKEIAKYDIPVVW